MQVWEAAPLIGVNGLLFGMQREEARRTLGGQYFEFRKNAFSCNTADDFGIAHVYYDGNDACEAIEIFPEVAVRIGGNVVFPGPIEELLRVIPDLSPDADGYVSSSKSVAITLDEGEMAGLLLGKEGYFSS